MERNAGPAGSARFRRRGIVSWFLRAQQGCFSGAGRAASWGRRLPAPSGIQIGIPGPAVQVRPMPVPGCSGAARRGRGSRRFRRGECVPFLESISAVPGAGGAPLRCQECAPHFLLSCQKKTCRARYKRKPPFIGLLVRPVETGLGSSSCAGPLALPVRSRRICVAYAKSLVQIGLLCATAPLPLSRQKKRVYAPAGKKLATNAQPLAAAAQEGPRVLFAPSGLYQMSQMRRKRHGSSGQ